MIDTPLSDISCHVSFNHWKGAGLLLWLISLLIYLLACSYQQQPLPLETGYLPWLLLLASDCTLTFEIAIIVIFKHAAALCLSGISAELALTQAGSDYQKANIASKIEGHFTASYEDYSIEQFIGFLRDTNLGLLSLEYTKVMADTAFRAT